MNAKERYLGMLAGRSVDIVPRVPILMQFAAEWIGSNYGAFASDYRVLVEANRRCAGEFGFDQLSAISDPYRETAAFGAEVQFISDGVPRCLHRPLADAKDLGRLLRPDVETSPRLRDRIDGVASMVRRGGEYSVLGWVEGAAASAATLRGTEQFLTDLIDDEPFAEALMDRCVETGVAFAGAQVRAGADTIGIGDALASQVSPDIYERLILPRQQTLVRGIHQAGGLVRLHICGNITHLLPGLAALAADVVDVDHMVDMAAVRRALGSRTALVANLDPAAAVRFGSPAAIRGSLRRLYHEVGNPFLSGAGCEVPAGTPEANLRALCEPLAYQA
ncbi:MAG: uroporphyrinogen decarboxylase family protein [Planctomycetota bacterium]